MTTPTPSPQAFKGLGVAFLGIGITFMSVAAVARMPIFFGVAPGFIALGVVFLAKSRQGG